MSSPLKYAPKSWVRFKLGSEEAVSQVLGARFMKGLWYYILSNPNGDRNYTIPESDIFETVD